MTNKIKQYFIDSIAELKKVIWPTKKETIKKTSQVIFLSFFVAIFLGIIDYGLTKLLETFVLYR